jgi:hypothetical protein
VRKVGVGVRVRKVGLGVRVRVGVRVRAKVGVRVHRLRLASREGRRVAPMLLEDLLDEVAVLGI